MKRILWSLGASVALLSFTGCGEGVAVDADYFSKYYGYNGGGTDGPFPLELPFDFGAYTTTITPGTLDSRAYLGPNPNLPISGSTALTSVERTDLKNGVQTHTYSTGSNGFVLSVTFCFRAPSGDLSAYQHVRVELKVGGGLLNSGTLSPKPGGTYQAAIYNGVTTSYMPGVMTVANYIIQNITLGTPPGTSVSDYRLTSVGPGYPGTFFCASLITNTVTNISASEVSGLQFDSVRAFLDP
jgi:hypothetical protein